MRDDFNRQVKETLARRVGYHCSNPDCRKLTSGPQQNPDKALSIGVAAHITAAAPYGPRYDSSLSKQARTVLCNAIWLCQNCAKLVDSDPQRYPVTRLQIWKEQAERAAHHEVAGTGHNAAHRKPDKPVAYRFLPDIDVNSREAQNNILYVSNIIDSHVDELERYIGAPDTSSLVNIGSLEEIPAGGEARDYPFNAYILSISYDTQGIAKSVRLEGLSEHGHTLYDRFHILYRLGISIGTQPDVIGIMSATWRNYHGFNITVALDRVDGVINIVRVYKVPK